MAAIFTSRRGLLSISGGLKPSDTLFERRRAAHGHKLAPGAGDGELDERGRGDGERRRVHAHVPSFPSGYVEVYLRDIMYRVQYLFGFQRYFFLRVLAQAVPVCDLKDSHGEI